MSLVPSAGHACCCHTLPISGSFAEFLTIWGVWHLSRAEQFQKVPAEAVLSSHAIRVRLKCIFSFWYLLVFGYRLFQSPLKSMEMCPLTSADSSLSLIDSNLIKIALNVLDPSGCCSCSLGCNSPQLFCALSVLFARVRESTRRLGNLTFLSLPRASFSPCSYLNECSQPPVAAYPRPVHQSLLLSTPVSFKLSIEGKERKNSDRALRWNWSSDTDAEFSKSKRIDEPCTGRCPNLITTWIILKLRLESTTAARCSHCPVLPPELWGRALAWRGWSTTAQRGRHVLESWGLRIKEARRWQVWFVTMHSLLGDSGRSRDNPTRHLLIRGKMPSPSRGLEPKEMS